ncbi:MAG: hypothetical protein HY574_00025 [candidate division NC10 bacterium]|nr:hypothetical protein [candidate division NC10 bacterium]
MSRRNGKKEEGRLKGLTTGVDLGAGGKGIFLPVIERFAKSAIPLIRAVCWDGRPNPRHRQLPEEACRRYVESCQGQDILAQAFFQNAGPHNNARL